MTTSEKIRTIYPLHLAKVYEAARLETEPRERVRKLVGLYEETVRTLALYGLAIYNECDLSDPAVEKVRAELSRPSLGTWLNLLKKLTAALIGVTPDLLAPPLNKIQHKDAVYEATRVMTSVLGQVTPKRVRHEHFLDALVQFRNRKVGHGQLSAAQAKQVVAPLERALDQWLDGLAILQQRHMLYIDKVSWQDPQFRYTGLNLNAGTSLYPFDQEHLAKTAPRQVYLHNPETGDFTSLDPLFWFDPDSHLLYVYNHLDAQSRAVLYCPYETASAASTHRVEIDSTIILGTPAGPRFPTIRPGITPSHKPVPEPPISITSPTTRGYSLMRNWFDIIPPHEDIRKGHFDEAIFAADLGDVYAGNAPPDYQDPFLFYKKTYPTKGLKGLLQNVYTKLTSGKGSAVVQIQTPFGGGKTHALVTLYHYAKNGERVKELLPEGITPLSCNVAVVGGNHWNPLSGYTSDGLTRHTFWGEIAYQLGGRAGYEEFRANDEARISPGKAELRDFLEAHQPFLILFDEVLEYINRALDVEIQDQLDVSLGTQTFSFFQELTEAVSSLANGMLVVTLPSSDLEDFGPEKQESLARLSKIFGRVESIETPVQGEEVYAVVRRRLFEVEKLQQTPMREVVHQYYQLYQQHKDDVPAKAQNVDYRDKMELAYPFHPDVIDILYEKWSTFPTFQRTRGVLRLLANVVEDLYQRETNIDLILPGDINLDRPSIRQEFLKHIGSEYEGIIGSDIAGHEAKAPMLDKANHSWKHLAQRTATAIFFHSFSADDSQRGINLPYIKLATMRSDTMPSLVTEVLGRLNNVLWYLNNRGDAYFFSRIPNLNRMILEKKEQYNESYREEMEGIIKSELGTQFRPYLWPDDGDGIPDNRELKLVVLKPEDDGSHIPHWLERKGESFREYKNSIFFALSETAAFARLKEQVKTYLALQEIQREVAGDPDSPLITRRSEIQQRSDGIKRDFSYNVRRMYHRLHLGERVVDLGQPVAGRETLGHWYWRELTSSDMGAIVEQLHYRMLVNKLLADNDQVPTSVILDQFYKNPDLPVPSQPVVIARSIQLGVHDDALGLAQVDDGSIQPNTLKYKEEIPLDAVSFESGLVLVTRGVCELIRAEQAAAQAEIEFGTDIPTGVSVPTPGITPTGADTEPGGEDVSDVTPPVLRYKRVHLVISDIPASKIADVNRGIFMPIKSAAGEFTFTLTLDVTSDDGISQTALENQIKETIRQIGATIDEEDLSP